MTPPRPASRTANKAATSKIGKTTARGAKAATRGQKTATRSAKAATQGAKAATRSAKALARAVARKAAAKRSSAAPPARKPAKAEGTLAKRLAAPARASSRAAKAPGNGRAGRGREAAKEAGASHPHPPVAYRLHALLHTMHAISHYDDHLCTLLTEVERAGTVNAALRRELQTLLDELPGRVYLSDLDAVRSALEPTATKRSAR